MLSSEVASANTCGGFDDAIERFDELFRSDSNLDSAFYAAYDEVIEKCQTKEETGDKRV